MNVQFKLQYTSCKLLFAVGCLVVSISTCHSFPFITAEDARQPSANNVIIERKGPFPGPEITIIKPAGVGSLRSPIELEVRYRARTGARVDLGSINIVYVKDTPINLTDRVTKRLGPAGFGQNGFFLSDAEVVPGTHTVRVDVRDSDGRVGTGYAKFTVAK